MRKQVSHDIHEMRAFVRLRQIGDTYVAWYYPDHPILPVVAAWFAKRFGSMKWSILTRTEVLIGYREAGLWSGTVGSRCRSGRTGRPVARLLRFYVQSGTSQFGSAPAAHAA